MSITIRKMLPEDVPQVCSIEHAVSLDPWAEKLFYDCISVGYSCWVLAVAATNDICGFGIISCTVGEAHVLNLAIKSDMQRQGLGKKLMVHLIQLARSLQADIIYLEVRESNLGAIALYRGLSFIEIGRRKGYYAKGKGREDAIVLALGL